MSNPFLAEIRVMPFGFAPKGWAFCDGQLMPISQNTALFSLIGTFYGGNGTSNFALPNLGGCFTMGFGQGAGLSPRSLGEVDGESTVTLLASEMPAHSHNLMAGGTPASTSPSGNVMAPTATGANVYHVPGPTTLMAGSAISPAGGSLPHENRQPYLALSFCIALQGVYPARS